MKDYQVSRSGRRRRVVAGVIAAATLLGMGAPAPAQTPLPPIAKKELPAFGMIGLGKGQVAILNLVLFEAPAENHPGCQVTASFVDAEGAVFNDLSGNAVTETFTLQPQVASELALPSAEILAAGQLRTRIRAVLTPVPSLAVPSRCACLMANLELVNANGHTTVLDYGKRNPSDAPDSDQPVPMPPRDGATPPPAPRPMAPPDRCTVVVD